MTTTGQSRSRRDTELRVIFGECDVDSGLLGVVDPCYWDDDDPLDYGAVMAGMYPAHAGHDGVASAEVHGGIVFGTEIGDGRYPVVGVYKNGRLQRVEIMLWESEGDESAEEEA